MVYLDDLTFLRFSRRRNVERLKNAQRFLQDVKDFLDARKFLKHKPEPEVLGCEIENVTAPDVLDAPEPFLLRPIPQKLSKLLSLYFPNFSRDVLRIVFVWKAFMRISAY